MPRSRPKVYAHQRHKKVLKFTKGQFGSRHRLFRRANEAMLKSLFYAIVIAATVSATSVAYGLPASTLHHG